MTIENTVSSNFLSAFVGCKERFRLLPTRCDIIALGKCEVHFQPLHYNCLNIQANSDVAKLILTNLFGY